MAERPPLSGWLDVGLFSNSEVFIRSLVCKKIKRRHDVDRFIWPRNFLGINSRMITNNLSLLTTSRFWNRSLWENWDFSALFIFWNHCAVSVTSFFFFKLINSYTISSERCAKENCSGEVFKWTPKIDLASLPQSPFLAIHRNVNAR